MESMLYYHLSKSLLTGYCFVLCVLLCFVPCLCSLYLSQYLLKVAFYVLYIRKPEQEGCLGRLRTSKHDDSEHVRKKLSALDPEVIL